MQQSKPKQSRLQQIQKRFHFNRGTQSRSRHFNTSNTTNSTTKRKGSQIIIGDDHGEFSSVKEKNDFNDSSWLAKLVNGIEDIDKQMQGDVEAYQSMEGITITRNTSGSVVKMRKSVPNISPSTLKNLKETNKFCPQILHYQKQKQCKPSAIKVASKPERGSVQSVKHLNKTKDKENKYSHSSLSPVLDKPNANHKNSLINYSSIHEDDEKQSSKQILPKSHKMDKILVNFSDKNSKIQSESIKQCVEQIHQIKNIPCNLFEDKIMDQQFPFSQKKIELKREYNYPQIKHPIPNQTLTSKEDRQLKDKNCDITYSSDGKRRTLALQKVTQPQIKHPKQSNKKQIKAQPKHNRKMEKNKILQQQKNNDSSTQQSVAYHYKTSSGLEIANNSGIKQNFSLKNDRKSSGLIDIQYVPLITPQKPVKQKLIRKMCQEITPNTHDLPVWNQLMSTFNHQNLISRPKIGGIKKNNGRKIEIVEDYKFKKGEDNLINPHNTSRSKQKDELSSNCKSMQKGSLKKQYSPSNNQIKRQRVDDKFGSTVKKGMITHYPSIKIDQVDDQICEYFVKQSPKFNNFTTQTKQYTISASSKKRKYEQMFEKLNIKKQSSIHSQNCNENNLTEEQRLEIGSVLSKIKYLRQHYTLSQFLSFCFKVNKNQRNNSEKRPLQYQYKQNIPQSNLPRPPINKNQYILYPSQNTTFRFEDQKVVNMGLEIDNYQTFTPLFSDYTLKDIENNQVPRRLPYLEQSTMNTDQPCYKPIAFPHAPSLEAVNRQKGDFGSLIDNLNSKLNNYIQCNNLEDTFKKFKLEFVQLRRNLQY